MSKVKVATQDLFVPGGEGWAAAHRKGDDVPYDTPEDRDRVDRGGWGDLLAGPDTKAAREAKGLPEPESKSAPSKRPEPRPAPAPDSVGDASKEN